MLNIEKVCAVWDNLEENYSTKGSGKTRIEFLKYLIGYKSETNDSVECIKMSVKKDLPDSEEFVIKFNSLVSKLERARKVIAECDKSGAGIVNLDEAVADSENTDTVVIDDNAIDCSTVSALDLLSDGLLAQGTYLIDGKLKSYCVDDSSADFYRHFSNRDEVVLFVMSVNQALCSGVSVSAFDCLCYCYLIDKVKKKSLELPAVFIDKGVFDNFSVNFTVKSFVDKGVLLKHSVTQYPGVPEVEVDNYFSRSVMVKQKNGVVVRTVLLSGDVYGS